MSKSKARVIIHMGATEFTVDVKGNDGFVRFDMNKMDKNHQHTFRKELTIAFREAQI